MVLFAAPPRAYARSGFRLDAQPDGTLAAFVRVLPSPAPEVPPPGGVVDLRRALLCQCGLSVALVGLRGMVVVDPTAYGLLVHRPNLAVPPRLRLLPARRTLLVCGVWLVDLFHGSAPEAGASGEGHDGALGEFEVERRRELLTVRRRCTHPHPRYRRPYAVTFVANGPVHVGLEPAGDEAGAPGGGAGRLRLDELAVKASIPGLLGIEAHFRARDP